MEAITILFSVLGAAIIFIGFHVGKLRERSATQQAEIDVLVKMLDQKQVSINQIGNQFNKIHAELLAHIRTVCDPHD